MTTTQDWMMLATSAHDLGDLDVFNAIALTLSLVGFRPMFVDDVLDGWENAGTYFSAYGERRWPLENSDGYLYRVHDPSLCVGRPCTIHNRTEHPMRSWPQHWRGDRGIMERICPTHGVGHPDPDSPWDADDHEWVHGCCGCGHES